MDTEFKKELENKRRLQELLTNIRNEVEEASFLLGHTPDASPELIAVFDRILRLLNEQ